MRSNTIKYEAGEFTTPTVDMFASGIPFYNGLRDKHRPSTERDSSCEEDQISTSRSSLTAEESPHVVDLVKFPTSPRWSRTICCGGGQRTRIRHLTTQHDYHDHAADPVAHSTMETTSSLLSSKSKQDSISLGPTNNFASTTTPFPMKLYEMIEQMESDGMSHVLSWQPHGRCFLVHEPHVFKKMVQNYYKLSKIASFQRQLNLYGFQRLTAGLDKGSYYHELFLRNRRDLVPQIHRVKVKGTGVRAKANPQDEPNLYMYPPEDDFAISAVACDSVAEIALLKQMVLTGMLLDESEPCFTEVSEYDVSTSRCEIRRGVAGNLASTNVLTLDDTSNSSSNTCTNFVDGIRPSARHGDKENVVNQMECFLEDSFPANESTTAVDIYLLANDGNDKVSFDKLIFEMFSHNQDIEFSKLVQLATEV
jgi:HSF-type DNA-binding